MLSKQNRELVTFRAGIRGMVTGIVSGITLTILSEQANILTFMFIAGSTGLITLIAHRFTSETWWDIAMLASITFASLALAGSLTINFPQADKWLVYEFVALTPATVILIRYWAGEFDQLNKTIHQSTDPIEITIFLIGVFVIVVHREVERLENRIFQIG